MFSFLKLPSFRKGALLDVYMVLSNTSFTEICFCCAAQFSHDKYQLWEFIRDLLHDPKYNPSIIQWENILDGVFRIVDSAEVARLWGRTKKFTKMTYDHMGRAFRYIYIIIICTHLHTLIQGQHVEYTLSFHITHNYSVYQDSG